MVSLQNGDEIVAKNDLDLKFYISEYNLPAKKPRIHLVLYNKHFIMFNKQVRVDCDVLSSNAKTSGFYSVEWIRENEDMSPRTYVHENSLIINNFNHEDLGKYVCRVSNNVGTTEKSITFFNDNNDSESPLKYYKDDMMNMTSEDLAESSPVPMQKLDERFKFIIGSVNSSLGDQLAIECYDLCKS